MLLSEYILSISSKPSSCQIEFTMDDWPRSSCRSCVIVRVGVLFPFCLAESVSCSLSRLEICLHLAVRRACLGHIDIVGISNTSSPPRLAFEHCQVSRQLRGTELSCSDFTSSQSVYLTETSSVSSVGDLPLYILFVATRSNHARLVL